MFWKKKANESAVVPLIVDVPEPRKLFAIERPNTWLADVYDYELHDITIADDAIRVISDAGDSLLAYYPKGQWSAYYTITSRVDPLALKGDLPDDLF